MATPEAEEFAALLKELKGRSGRSYGVLAGKLHVSTSTLHRYCNGDAVPNEYAPVERLARLCAATPDEMVELHRRWILADAARGRAKPEVPSEPEASSGPEVPSGPEVAEVPEAAEATKSAEAAEVLEVPEVSAGPEQGAAPRSRWRRASARTRVLLAAAAVVALTVPTALALGELSGDGPDTTAGARDGKGADTVSALPERESASASTPSPSKSSGSPSPSASGTPSARASASATPSGGSAPKGGTGRPPTVTISSYNWQEPCGQYYLLNQAPDRVPPPPSPDNTRGWARALGGVDGGSMLLELTVQGPSQEAVVLHGLHVRVLSHRAPLERTAYSMGEGCGSGIEPQSFAVDLDDSSPLLKPVAGQQGDEVVPAKNFPFRVSSSDVEVFDLDAHVEGHDVSWYLELEWSSGGRKGMLRIDDGGKPFRTSSIAGRPLYAYQYDVAQWQAR
ncbi:helix-turn-helix transcriptional regulator [Streptomyces sp. ITFR-16]|uniref:helix-turn-helix domain-containing protein n=1 Tax=Streptomyces sp. ITFR-16 TaxID=3075198 RepID=UPI00288B20A9|nr:helix-turn-helix transcriptional regulator [Streptomyces sp. ITFR-16]WNI24167.1 helix-turn-helix transcriptional regulator [Streptomyces sp. ITFR-16]